MILKYARKGDPVRGAYVWFFYVYNDYMSLIKRFYFHAKTWDDLVNAYYKIYTITYL